MINIDRTRELIRGHLKATRKRDLRDLLEMALDELETARLKGEIHEPCGYVYGTTACLIECGER